MEDDILSSVPQTPQDNSSVPTGGKQDAVDDSPLGDRVFDITDDLNISPVNENPQAVLRSELNQQRKPAQAIPPRPAQPMPRPGTAPISQTAFSAPITQKPPVQAAAGTPVPFPGSQPRQPINIPLSDFTKPLQKAQSAPAPTTPAPAIPRPTPTPLKIDPVTGAVQQNPPAGSSEDFFPKSADLKALRTYESDVAEVLAHTRASTASIAIAEAKKENGEDRIQNNEESESSTHAGLKTFITILCLILVLAGAGGAYYLYSKSALAPSTPAPAASEQARSLVPADSQDVIVIDGLSPTAVLNRIDAEFAKPLPSNSITEVIPAQTNSAGQKVRVAATDMLSLMEINPPDVLTRSLNPSWMVGVYTDGSGQKSGFVVVTTNFFQNAFAGMLQWENVMADDLKQYLTSGSVADIANVPAVAAPSAPVLASSTNASTTKSTASSTDLSVAMPMQQNSAYALRGHFEDRIIMNKDVRVFVTSDGKILFLYSFIDNTRLVVAGNEATLKEILSRLENQSFIR